MNQFSSMQDLVRRTCDDAQEMPEFEGVYEEDPEQIKAWEEWSPEYDGKWKYVNMGPTKLRKLIEAGEELEPVPLQAAMEYWGMAAVYGEGYKPTKAGTVDRGDEREAVYADTLGEVAASSPKAEHVYVMGEIGFGGIPKMGEPIDPETYADGGIIDWSELPILEDCPEPLNDDDWF
jgi:hypothetical protein